MPDLKEALLQAKLVTKSQVEKHEKQLKQKKEQKKEQKEPSFQKSPDLLDKKFEKFENIWNNEKSKKFAMHLLHAFLPFDDNYIIFSWEDKKNWKNGKKCCICNQETLAKQDLFEHLDEIATASMDAMIKSLRDENFNPSKELAEEKKKIFGDKIVGVTSESTSVIMCMSCYQLFTEWIHTKLLCDGDFGDFSKAIRFIRLSKAKDQQQK